MKHESWVKIQTFVPPTYLDGVLKPIGEIGVNTIGNYNYCAFVTTGEGCFRPFEGAQPTIGRVGQIEKVGECKVEFVYPQNRILEVKSAICKVHPYEEIPLDVFPLIRDS